MTPDGTPITETNRAEAVKKRFWKTVNVKQKDDKFTVNLDGRPLKTPDGRTLALPKSKPLFAGLIAAEWEFQETLLKPFALPMTSIASRALDAMAEQQTRTEVCESLLKYLDTDTICYQHDEPPPLVNLQTRHWDPLLDWVQSSFDVRIERFASILPSPQPVDSKNKLREVISKFDLWELAAMERVTYATKSFIIALALVKRHINVDEAALASHVEVNSQIERWGEVEDTHDVDFHDIRRQLGSAACLLSSQ